MKIQLLTIKNDQNLSIDPNKLLLMGKAKQCF